MSKGVNISEKPAQKLSDYFVENLSMDDLYKLIERYKLHLGHLQSNTMCLEENKGGIVHKIRGGITV